MQRESSRWKLRYAEQYRIRRVWDAYVEKSVTNRWSYEPNAALTGHRAPYTQGQWAQVYPERLPLE